MGYRSKIVQEVSIVPHHLTDRATEKLTAQKNQIHHRDPGDAGNPIFKSVLSSMVDLNFSLNTEVACQCFGCYSEPRGLFINRVSRRGDFFFHNGDFGEQNFGFFFFQGFF